MTDESSRTKDSAELILVLQIGKRHANLKSSEDVVASSRLRLELIFDLTLIKITLE